MALNSPAYAALPVNALGSPFAGIVTFGLTSTQGIVDGSLS